MNFHRIVVPTLCAPSNNREVAIGTQWNLIFAFFFYSLLKWNWIELIDRANKIYPRVIWRKNNYSLLINNREPFFPSESVRSNRAAVLDSTLELFSPSTHVWRPHIPAYFLKVKGVCPPITSRSRDFLDLACVSGIFPNFSPDSGISGGRARSTERISRSNDTEDFPLEPLSGIIPLGFLHPQRSANWIRNTASGAFISRAMLDGVSIGVASRWISKSKE